MKLQKLSDLLVNLVDVFEARKIKGVTPLRTAKAAIRLIGVHPRMSNPIMSNPIMSNKTYECPKMSNALIN